MEANRYAFRLRLAGAGIALVLALLAGCSDECEECDCTVPDTTPPAAPRGLVSITGDGKVTLVWFSNVEPDVAGYAVYRNSTGYDAPYHEIATVPHDPEAYTVTFVDRDVENGETYYYAVAAFDEAGNEGDLSIEDVHDTPRPDGRDTIADAAASPVEAGFDLSRGVAVDSDDERADFYYWVDPASPHHAYLIAGSEAFGEDDPTAVQDMGWTADFDEIGYAPDAAWSPSGVVEAIEDHTYVLHTRDGHYAKVRLLTVEREYVSFEWAYQLDPGNRELEVR